MNYKAVISVEFTDEGDEKVTLAEVKKWCEIDVTDRDAELTELITAARSDCEAYANISMIERTVEARLVKSLGGINLPYGPVKDFTELKDCDDEVIDAADYKATGSSFMQLKTAFENEVTATYTAGYVNLPKNLKYAILNQVDHLFNNRGADTGEALSAKTKSLLQPFRRD